MRSIYKFQPSRDMNPRRAAIRSLLFVLVLGLSGPVILAQGNPPAPASVQPENPLIGHSRMTYGMMKTWLLRSAEKMPEENYGFKPTAAVRSFGSIVGHLADQHYRFCSLARGESYPNLKIEQTKTSKADLTSALKEAFAYCDKAYEAMNDKSAVETVKLGSLQHPKLGLLTVNLAHSSLHYGNLITYMRLKNVVPPSTEMMEAAGPKN
jgi:uncharacterized damage-inducible protein DinB